MRRPSQSREALAMPDRRDLEQLLSADHAGPCVSIYQPTHRQHPDNLQNPIRFRNLVKQAADSLGREYAATSIDAVLAKFDTLAGDAEFWNHTSDGLAVFGASDMFRVLRLQRPVPTLAIVASST